MGAIVLRFPGQAVHASSDPPDTFGGGHARRDVDNALAGHGTGLAYDAVGGRLQVQDPGAVGVSGLFLAIVVAAVEDDVIGGCPRPTEGFHGVQDGCFPAARRGGEHEAGVCENVGDGLVADDHRVLAGGPQLAR